MTDDRTVHASRGDHRYEVVRYDRAGKWYIESSDPANRRLHVTVDQAVTYAMVWRHNGGYLHLGRPGGTRFDRLVRDRIAK